MSTRALIAATRLSRRRMMRLRAPRAADMMLQSWLVLVVFVRFAANCAAAARELARGGNTVGPALAQFTLAHFVLVAFLLSFLSAALSLGAGILVWRYVTDAVAPRESRQKMGLRQLLRPEGVDKAGLRNLNTLYANAAMEGFAFSSIGPLMVLFLAFRFVELDASSIPLIVGLAMGLGVAALVSFLGSSVDEARVARPLSPSVTVAPLGDPSSAFFSRLWIT